MKLFLTKLLFAICLLTSSAQAQGRGVPGGIPGPPPPEAAKSRWEDFTSPDASFSVIMPGKPTSQTQLADTLVGKLQSYTFMLSINGETYAVSYIDYPSGLDTPATIKVGLDGVRDLGLSRLNGKLISEKDIAYEQYPGRELTAEVAGGNFRARHYVVQRRFYSLLVFSPNRLDPGKNASKFFESFKLLRQENRIAQLAADQIQAAKEELRQQAREFFKQPTAAREFSSSEGGFSIWLPSEPFQHTELTNPADDRSIVRTLVAAGERLICSVVYQDLLAPVKAPDEIKLLFDRVRVTYVEARNGKLTEETPISLNSYSGREFKAETRSGVSIGRIYLVNQRLYVLWVMVVGRDYSANVAKFFDSFKVLQVPANKAEVQGVPRGRIYGDPVGLPPSKSASSPNSGSVLQSNAINKVSPSYPEEAKKAHVSGTVLVRVLLSEEGKVIEAEAISGPEMLREAAVQAAKQWTFKPTLLQGMPVKVEGILTFNFKLQ